jgi:hypothetical protein
LGFSQLFRVVDGRKGQSEAAKDEEALAGAARTFGTEKENDVQRLIDEI